MLGFSYLGPLKLWHIISVLLLTVTSTLLLFFIIDGEAFISFVQLQPIFEKKLHDASTKPVNINILFISIVNHREQLMTQNWILSMIRAGFTNNFRLISLDEMAYNEHSIFIKNNIQNLSDIDQYIYSINGLLPNESVFANPTELKHNKIPFRIDTKSFKVFTCLRPIIIKQILKKMTSSSNDNGLWTKYNALFYIDIDTFMYKTNKAWNKKLSLYWNDDNIVFGADPPGTKRCSCYIFISNIKNKNKIKRVNKILNDWNIKCNEPDIGHDQSALEAMTVNFTLLNEDAFPNGHKYKYSPEWMDKHYYRDIDGKLMDWTNITQKKLDNNQLFPYLIHANYISQLYMKIKLLKQYNAWLLPNDQI